ncbi:MAG: spore maturation protein [Holdemania massiliensis]
MESSLYILPVLILLIFVFALLHQFNAYDAFVGGAKEGLSLFVTLFPSLLAMMFAVSLLRESGLFTVMAQQLGKIFPAIPSDIFALAFFRPISGSASLAILVDILKTLDRILWQENGKCDSGIDGYDAVCHHTYFSSVGVKKIKNALPIGLFADVIGIGVGIG